MKVFKQQPRRPSKCPKFYTNRILGEQNFCQKVRKFFQNSNCNKMTYLIKYTFTVQFSIPQATICQLTKVLLFIKLLPKKYAKLGPKSQSTTKHCMFRATNGHQFREFYTNAVGDVGDI